MPALRWHHLVVSIALILVFAPMFWGIMAMLWPILHSPTQWLEPLIHFYQWPGLTQSWLQSIMISLLSTLSALWLSFQIIATYALSRRWRSIERWLTPLLSLPHMALAMGLVLLLAPSGWLARLFQQWFTHIHWPIMVQDTWGIGMILTLIVKEVPFFILMGMAAISQLRVRAQIDCAQNLGYTPASAWRRLILPQWLPLMRLPIFAVLSFGLSVVDVALIIGPTRPANLSILIWQWLRDPQMTQGALALVGILHLCLTLGVMMLIWQKASQWLCTAASWQVKGKRKGWNLGRGWFSALTLLSLLTLPLMLLWSFAQRWPRGALWPSQWQTRLWQQQSDALFDLLQTSFSLAMLTSALALVLALIIFYQLQRYQRQLPAWLIALPMVIPQLALLFGIQVSIHQLSAPPFWWMVAWGHLLFVFPYVYLSISGPLQAFDQRYLITAQSLGYGPIRAWLKVALPLLKRPLAIAFAVGASVSLAQYLPTLMLGSGRIQTLATEAVAVTSGYDRRLIGIYALLQAMLPFIVFSVALLLSRPSALMRKESYAA
ncbi:hypothetical protein VST7929_00894 [Vibrio stylophorae]|uniref:ABC transmembrane type-1 domain-containing protein n=2 Tax=Vibrio stylophorae TaxID=659351 RepID=A0ABM8ZRW5_9VIBR|nr:hypothetical protein VST7929_00894 [Vibrio stylophorae]